MIVELGHMALIGACVVSCAQIVWFVLGLCKKEHISFCTLLDRRLGHVATGQVTFAIVALFVAFWRCDFSVQYVFYHANTHLPWYYRLCALWGGHEGSLLLWLWLLTLWVSVVKWCYRNEPPRFQSALGGVMATIIAAFSAFMLLTSNPFLRFLPSFPAEGRDLNPLLQDPGLVSHPPILYMGYVGFAMVFGLAMAGLLASMPNRWVRLARPVAALAWSFLTLGIVLGSLWAYRELGWGGVWFWDPVENASFMPWLIGTGLIHALMGSEKRGYWQAWSLLLAMFAFILSLLGTFLVRSGVVISVHAFAEDPSRGVGLLLMLAILSTSALWVFARSHKQAETNQAICMRGWLLLAQYILASIATLIVLIGTLFPILSQWLSGQSISVGAPYFNTVLWPMVLLASILMGLIPHMPWGQYTPPTKFAKLRHSLLFALVVGLGAMWWVDHAHGIAIGMGVFMATWLILTSLQALFQKKGGMGMAGCLAHVGLAVCIVGVVFGHYQASERYVTAKVGSNFEFAGEHWHWVALKPSRGPNYQDMTAHIEHHPKNQPDRLAVVAPRLRHYTTQTMDLAKVAIERHVWGDWYIAIGQTQLPDVWTIRLYKRPMVWGVWFGGVLMMMAGLLVCRRGRR